MRRLPGWRAAALLAVALPGSALGAAAATAAERGVSAERVLFGQSAAFSGPAGELGRAISEQRRRPTSGGRLVIVPVNTRTWTAHVPNDAPPVVRALLSRLQSG